MSEVKYAYTHPLPLYMFALLCISCITTAHTRTILYNREFSRDKIFADGSNAENLQIKLLRMVVRLMVYVCIFENSQIIFRGC